MHFAAAFKARGVDIVTFISYTDIERHKRIEIDNKMASEEIRGAYDRFPDFFRMGTFTDSTHMKL